MQFRGKDLDGLRGPLLTQPFLLLFPLAGMLFPHISLPSCLPHPLQSCFKCHPLPEVFQILNFISCLLLPHIFFCFSSPISLPFLLSRLITPHILDFILHVDCLYPSKSTWNSCGAVTSLSFNYPECQCWNPVQHYINSLLDEDFLNELMNEWINESPWTGWRAHTLTWGC